MPPLEGVVPTLTPQGVGKGDRPKWHGHRAGEKGGAGALANIVEHAGGRTGKPAVFLPVGAGPFCQTGCGLTLGLGAFGWGQLVRDRCMGAAKRFDWVRSNAWSWSTWLGRRLLHMTKPPPSLCEFRRLHAVGGCLASARLIGV